MQSRSPNLFGYLFRKYRLRSEIETLADFANIFAEMGTVYETSLFSRWQNGDRFPRNRSVVLKIISIFVSRGGMRSKKEINEFLASVGQRDISHDEENSLNIQVKPFFYLVPNRNSLFIGRDTLIKHIMYDLISRKNILIQGMPGSGKTATAVEIAYAVRDVFQDGIFWFHKEMQTEKAILHNFTSCFKDNSKNIDSNETIINRVRKLISGRRCLFIFEDISRELISQPIVQDMVQSNSSVIFTSHDLICADQLIRYQLQPLTYEEFITLATKVLGKPYVDTKKDQLLRIGRNIAFHPAVALLVFNQLHDRPQMKHPILKASPKDLTIAFTEITYDNKNLYNSLQVCYRRLSFPAKKILAISALLSGSDFSINVISFDTNFPSQQIQQSLSELQSQSFLYKTGTQRFGINPVFRAYLCSNLRKEDYVDGINRLCKYYIRELQDLLKKSKIHNRFISEEGENIYGLLKLMYRFNYFDEAMYLWSCYEAITWQYGYWEWSLYQKKLLTNSDDGIFNSTKLSSYYMENIDPLKHIRLSAINIHQAKDTAMNICP